MSEKEAEQILLALCHGSLHAHLSTIRKGYISLPLGVRVGLVGRAGGGDGAVRGITAFCFRIPHFYTGNADAILDQMSRQEYARGVLLYSLPGVGKTTLLREIARRLSSPPYLKRVAIVDTRCELFREQDFRGCLCDVLFEYPKDEGICIAVRTLSPQILVCDEIGAEEEARAILSVNSSGVPLVCSVHGDCARRVCHRPGIRCLIENGVFGSMFSLRRENGRMILKNETAEMEKLIC